MNRIVVSFVLLCFLSTCSLFAQFAYIPHITSSAGGFETEIWLVRVKPSDVPFSLTGVTFAGQEMVSSAIEIKVGESLKMDLSELFAAEDVSWLRFDANAGVVATAQYKAKGDEKGTAHSHQTMDASTRWRIYAGENRLVWDGLALVNPHDEPSSFFYEAFDETGQSIGSIFPFAPLMPLGKDLTILSDSLPNAAYYEISSQFPLVLTSLRGDQAGADRLWVNPAVSLAEDEE